MNFPIPPHTWILLLLPLPFSTFTCTCAHCNLHACFSHLCLPLPLTFCCCCSANTTTLPLTPFLPFWVLLLCCILLQGFWDSLFSILPTVSSYLITHACLLLLLLPNFLHASPGRIVCQTLRPPYTTLPTFYSPATTPHLLDCSL